MFMGEAINRTNSEFNVDRFGKADIIVEKEVCESNLFGLLLTSNKSLIPKKLSLRTLPSIQLLILIYCCFMIMESTIS